jgi:lysozyme
MSLRRMLEDEEGRVPHAYPDSLGYWTIGVGRLIDRRKGGGLSDDEIDYLLANDIRGSTSSTRCARPC